ncbi:MAG TPA: GxxExxY protein [Steroidobacteraceae bacterium]|nr:GxxExxY protein [Steroidobacteraceae bacterium]
MNEDEIGRLVVDTAVPVPVVYDGLSFDEGFRIDLIVEGKVIVELKCVEKLHYAHRKQLLTYLCLADKRLGYLLNFGEALMKNGVVRLAPLAPWLENSMPLTTLTSQ